MFRGVHGSFVVIYHYRRVVKAVIGPAKEHQGQSPPLDLQVIPEISGFLRYRGQDTVYTGTQKSGDPFLFELRLLVRLVNEHIIPVLIGHVLYAMYHRAKEIDLPTGIDNTKDNGSARPERIGDPVAMIVHTLGSILHQLTGAVTGTLAVIQCPGHCRPCQVELT